MSDELGDGLTYPGTFSVPPRDKVPQVEKPWTKSKVVKFSNEVCEGERGSNLWRHLIIGPQMKGSESMQWTEKNETQANEWSSKTDQK